MFHAKVKPSAFLHSLLGRILQLPLNLVCQNIVLGEPHVYHETYSSKERRYLKGAHIPEEKQGEETHPLT